jgi:hypothetical protein
MPLFTANFIPAIGPAVAKGRRLVPADGAEAILALSQEQ